MSGRVNALYVNAIGSPPTASDVCPARLTVSYSCSDARFVFGEASPCRARHIVTQRDTLLRIAVIPIGSAGAPPSALTGKWLGAHVGSAGSAQSRRHSSRAAGARCQRTARRSGREQFAPSFDMVRARVAPTGRHATPRALAARLVAGVAVSGRC